MILHLVSKAEWEAKPSDQPYLPDAFSKDGFIHCTQGDELLLQVADNYYKGVPGDFLALVIDESKVQAPVKWEPPDTGPVISEPPASQGPSEPAPNTIEPPPEVKAEYGTESLSPSPLLPLSPAPQAQTFPHIYGPLNRDAIVEIRRVVRAPDGTFKGFAPQESSPEGMHLKSPSQLADELVDATGEFSDALARYKDRIQARMDELDKNIKDKLS
ncbi:MAG: DUF952 domain-containing protein [Chloroflexi bacterium]|nr:DUF952 domain-containing protein [Chloroflexota bacterium]